MNFDSFRDWLGPVMVIWNFALTAVLWLRKPGNDAVQAVGALRKDVDMKLETQSKTIAEIQAHMKHMPTNEELAELEGTVRQINERTTGLADSMTTVRTSLHRIEDFLLRNR